MKYFLVMIYLTINPLPPTEKREAIPHPTIEECEAMRHQRDHLPPASPHDILIGSYCEER